jgi:hypothetical protein
MRAIARTVETERHGDRHDRPAIDANQFAALQALPPINAASAAGTSCESLA